MKKPTAPAAFVPLSASPDEVVTVALRMTKAERHELRKMSVELDMPMQDIVRRGFYLFIEAQAKHD
jgi:hypothetical protein